MDEEVERFREQHENSYKESILKTIKNNTTVLVDGDIKSLLKTPPLDSMDVIKSKYLEIAKKNKVVLNTEDLNSIIDKYRKKLMKCCDDLSDIRLNALTEKVNSFDFSKDNTVIKINKKDFTVINKEMKKVLKDYLDRCYEAYIKTTVDKLFNNSGSDDILNKIKQDINNFFKKVYNKQLLENFDIKVLVKDTILVNTTKEQTERYLFILNNSRIFK